MKTKRIELHIDLYPGWQDVQDSNWTARQYPNGCIEKPTTWKRFKITVDIPCFGGTADIDGEISGQVSEV